MTRIIIDMTGDEEQWNGEISINVQQDTLTGSDVALAIGEHEIIGSTTQMITLHEKLDFWLNAIAERPRGNIERRLDQAIDAWLATAIPRLGEAWAATVDRRELLDNLKAEMDVAGLRFGLAVVER